jgi:RNA polymerase primary sigma factor
MIKKPYRIVDVSSISDFFERTECLKSYYEDIRKYPLLTKEEEYNLFEKYYNGSNFEKEKAREKIINHNLRFVVSVAKKYANNENILDVIEEGTMGLIEALESFDYTKGYKFISYAVHYIRRAINQYRVEYDDLVKKTNYNKTFHLMTKTKNDFVQQNHRQPTLKELKDLLNEKYDTSIKNECDVMDIQTVSIDVNFDSDDDMHGDEYSEYNKFTANNNDCEMFIENQYLKELVLSMVSELPSREQIIIKMSFGIDNNKEYDIQEIGELLGISGERVRQLKLEAIDKMKEYYMYYKNKDI